MPANHKPKRPIRSERPSARRSLVPAVAEPIVSVKPDAATDRASDVPPSNKQSTAPRVGARRTGIGSVEAPRSRKPKQSPMPAALTAVRMSEPPPPAHPTVQEQLHDIEQRLDALLDDVHHDADDVSARKRAAAAIGHIAAHLEGGQQSPDLEGTTLLSSARELLSSDYYVRKWGRIGMRHRSEHVDDFGLDPTYEARVQPLFDALYERYFRVETEGLEHIPAQGRVLLIGNHSGTIPLDGVMLKTAISVHHPARRPMRWLAEDFVFHFPFLGAFMNRIGAVRACQENAQRLLAQESLLAVFPEGIQGIGKLYRDRYRLQRFGRGGYIKLALRTGTPIVPVAIVGAEETYPLLLKLTKVAKPLGVPFVPVTPLFPWFGPVGLLPLPSRWRICVGAPIEELSEYGPSDAEDPIVVNRLNERVRQAIQEMLETSLRRRGESAFVAAS